MKHERETEVLGRLRYGRTSLAVLALHTWMGNKRARSWRKETVRRVALLVRRGEETSGLRLNEDEDGNGFHTLGLCGRVHDRKKCALGAGARDTMLPFSHMACSSF